MNLVFVFDSQPDKTLSHIQYWYLIKISVRDMFVHNNMYDDYKQVFIIVDFAQYVVFRASEYLWKRSTGLDMIGTFYDLDIRN